MLEGLYAAASGMEAQQQQLDSIGNDLANASTTGYKAERVGFRELLYNQVDIAGTTTTQGAGAAAQSIGRDQAQGSIQSTGDPLDLAIEGPGYFTVKRADGTVALTRDGSLQVNARGQLTTAEGNLLDPPITLPKGATPSEVAIALTAPCVSAPARSARSRSSPSPRPITYSPPGATSSPASASSGTPRPSAKATIQQGALEGSNVDVGNDMVQMMGAQRSYQLESSAIQTENQMLSIANQLVTQ